MYDHWKTTELIEHVLLSATELTGEQLELVERFDRLLDDVFALHVYLQAEPSDDSVQEAYRDFAESVIERYLRG